MIGLSRGTLALGWLLLAALCALPATGQHPLLLATAIVVAATLAYATARYVTGHTGGRQPIRVRSQHRRAHRGVRRGARPPHNPRCPRAPGDH